MQYEAAPLLLKLMKRARKAESKGKKKLAASWLREQKPVKELSKLLGKPVVRWSVSGRHAKRDDVFTVDQILGATQSACAIVLAAMNARRQREVCDERYGVRVGDLDVIDDELGVYRTEFYIEKTYFDRHTFYINRTSADALRCLESLKEACLPQDAVLAPGASLFSCGQRTELGIGRDIHMIFSGDRKRARSLTSFFEVALKGVIADNDATAHMFRRFYAILYYHRYDHADLRALRQHLRHLDVAMTRVYITDPSNRELAESIQKKVGQDRFSVADKNLHSALDNIHADIAASLDEVGQEKLHQAVVQVLSGEPTAGGFSRIIGKLYRQMLANVSFAKEEPHEIAVRISERLKEHGYLVRPMLHGQCHAPEAKRHLKAKCEKNGALAQEHAGPQVCNLCPYHFNNGAYLENLREQLDSLKTDSHDIFLPPLAQKKAEFDLRNLQKVISLMEEEMQNNAQRIQSSVSMELRTL